MAEFGPVTEALVRDLRRIVGSQGVVYGDREALSAYAADESGGEYYAHMPDVVVRPTTTEQVSGILRLAQRAGVPVTPRGAGSGLAGGAVPLYGGIVVSLERMNRILELDRRNLVAVVEPGVVTNDLCRAAASAGLYYPGYPMSVESSFIGGNVATNAGGSRVIKYGNTGKHVLGLEVVLAGGEVVQFGGKRRKNSSGYNMVPAFVGSEGTLGIFTRIVLNLIPSPGRTVDLLAPFPDPMVAAEAVPRLIAAGRELPAAVEFIDRLSAELGARYGGMELPFRDRAGAYLIVQLEGRDRQGLETLYDAVGDELLASGALNVFVAENRTNSERIWRVRRNWLESIKAVDPSAPSGDVVVPISAVPEMLSFIAEVSRETGVMIPVASHVADGNIHPVPIRPHGISPEEWRSLSEGILERIALKAAELGGAVSGEHGIGFLKRELLARTKPHQVEVMRSLKQALDPQGIMNPGKLFP